MPALALLTTLICMGVVFSLLHLAILWLGLSDLLALLAYAAPITLYIAYCTHRTRAAIWRSALQIYTAFSSVVLAASGLVYLIGN